MPKTRAEILDVLERLGERVADRNDPHYTNRAKREARERHERSRAGVSEAP